MAKPKLREVDDVPDASNTEVQSTAIVPVTPEEASLLARLDKLDSDRDFTTTEDDEFWKALKPGDELRGIYRGATREGRYLTHHVIRRAKDGSPVDTRVNGTMVLTRMLKRVEPGTVVLIRFDKEVPSTVSGGNPCKLYTVKVGK